MVVESITFKVKRGREREFERHIDDYVRMMRRSRGFISHILLKNADDPAQYRVEVRWASREHRDRWSASEEGAVRGLSQARGDLLESPPARLLLEIV